MFASFLVGLVLSAHQQPKVSLELRGVRLENAAPILAKTFGMDFLQIGPTLKNEVLLVRANEVDPETLKEYLAKAVHGSWVHKTEGWWFMQTEEQKDADKKTYDKERYRFFSEIVAKAKKKMAALKPLDEAECKRLAKEIKNLSMTPVSRTNNNFYRRYQKIDEQGPLKRLANRIAERITPEVWMKLTDQNPRIVFCNQPNSMQQPFPIRVDDLFAQAIQEQNLWSSVAGGEPLGGPSPIGEENTFYYLGDMNQHRQPFKSSDFGLFTMTVQLNDQNIEFMAYDSKGHQSLNTYISGYEYSEEDANTNYEEEYKKLLKNAVNLTGDAAEYLDLISPRNIFELRQRTKKAISPSLLAKLLHPEMIDPLSIAAPDVYLSAIETPNVVMVLNDNQRAARFAEFKNARFSRLAPSSIVDANGWFLYSQPNPIANRKVMPDRKRLGQTMRYISENKRPLNLEEQANLAFDLPWETDMSYAYKSHLDPLQISEVQSYNNRSALRIYGSLNGGERERAKKGGIPFSVLTDSVKRELFRALFYVQKYESQVQVEWNGRNNMTQAIANQFNEIQSLLYGGIYEEKTFLLPNGLTNSLSFSIEDNSVSNLYCGSLLATEGQNYYGEGRTMNPNSLGQYLFKSTNPQKYRYEVMYGNKINENDIHLSSQRTLVMKLKLNDMLNIQWNLTQTLLTDPNTYTTKNLPQGVMDEMKKGYAEAEKMDKDPNRSTYYGAQPPRKSNIPPQ